jgi:hypothetical protein
MDFKGLKKTYTFFASRNANFDVTDTDFQLKASDFYHRNNLLMKASEGKNSSAYRRLGSDHLSLV